MRLSLRYRLLIPLALLLAGDAAATAWAARIAARNAEQRLAIQQWNVAHALTEPPFFPLTETVLKKMQNLSGAEFLFTNPPAPPLSTFPDPKPPAPEDVPTAERPNVEDTPTLGPPVVVAGREYRCLRLPLTAPHPNAGGNLYIFYPDSLRREAVANAVRPLVLLGGMAGLIAIVLAFVFGSRLVKRVRDIDERTRLIAKGDFRIMPLPDTNDELRDLGAAVNDMAHRLACLHDELQQNERLKVLGQFSGGLAHQLRNAATGAKLALEVYLAENPSADPEPVRVALRQLARIEANLRQFLALGKPPTEERLPCDLAKLIDQAIRLLMPQCRHAGIRLNWEAPGKSCMIMGDHTALSHLFGNVISNAVDAAGPGGEVSVALIPRNGYAQIEIADSGPGPPPDIEQKLFDPFVTGKEQGVGLGLAVARQAAESHCGTLRWERNSGKTVFVIELPTPLTNQQ